MGENSNIRKKKKKKIVVNMIQVGRLSQLSQL